MSKNYLCTYRRRLKDLLCSRVPSESGAPYHGVSLAAVVSAWSKIATPSAEENVNLVVSRCPYPHMQLYPERYI